MSASWFLIPVAIDKIFDGEIYRECEIFGHQDEIFRAGGAWAQTEIDGNLSLVRVRAGAPLLASLGLKYSELSDTEAQAAWTPTRRKPSLAPDKSAILLGAARVPTLPLTSLIASVPDVAPPKAVANLLAAWLALGFGLGWRIPYALALTLAVNGVEPDRWGRVGFPDILQSVPYSQRYAFPVSSVVDNFNRANENPLSQSAAWTTGVISGQSALTVATNQCVGSSAGSNSAYRSTIMSGADEEAFVTIATHGSNNDFAVFARLANPGSAGAVDGYKCQLALGGTQQIRLQRLDNDVPTQIAAVNQTITGGDGAGIECVGSNIAGYFNDNGAGWAAVTSVADATYGAAGYLGLQQNNTMNVGDDFGGGILAAAAASLLLRREQMAVHLTM